MVDVGAGYIYHPYLVINAQDNYYGVHVHIDSLHKDEVVDHPTYDMLYSILKETDAGRLAVDLYYNTGTNEINKGSYQSRFENFEQSKSGQLAFGILLALAGVAVVAGNVVTAVKRRRREAT